MTTYRRLIREFRVSPDDLRDLTFSDLDKIGITDDKKEIALRTTFVAGRPSFPINDVTGVRFTTPAVAGSGIRQFEFAEFETVTPGDPNDPAAVTLVRGRLHDGTTEYWFTGGAWTAVTDPALDWNTLEEVSNNLPTWNPDLALGFVFELSTTSRTLTPVVRGVKVLYNLDLPSFHNDWLFVALVAQMEENIRPIADLITAAPTPAVLTIDLSATIAGFESQYELTGVDAVFNEVADPAHRVDILDSYDTGTNTITLTALQPEGDRLLIRFQYAPTVAVTTDQDYSEIGSTPAITFETVDWEDGGEASNASNIVNVFLDPPLGVILPAPRRQHLAVTLVVTSPGSINLRRLAETVTRFLQDRRVLSSPTDGRKAYLRITNIFGASPLPDQSGLHSATMDFRLEDVYVWIRDAIETTGVRAGGLMFEFPFGDTDVNFPVGGT